MEGRKIITKIFHLSNWNLVRAPKDHGGQGVWDPEIVNLALGSKILWRLVSGKNKWWKKTLIRMYMSGKWKRPLDSPPSQSKVYLIWKLLKTSFPLIQSSLHWVPENGKKINLWKDGILGSHPIHQNVSLSDIRQWMISQNKISWFTPSPPKCLSQWY